MDRAHELRMLRARHQPVPRQVARQAGPSRKRGNEAWLEPSDHRRRPRGARMREQRFEDGAERRAAGGDLEDASRIVVSSVIDVPAHEATHG